MRSSFQSSFSYTPKPLVNLNVRPVPAAIPVGPLQSLGAGLLVQFLRPDFLTPVRASFLPGCSRLCIHCTGDSETWSNLTLCPFRQLMLEESLIVGLRWGLRSSTLSDAWLFIGCPLKLQASVHSLLSTRPSPGLRPSGNHQADATLRRGYSRFPVVDPASGQARSPKALKGSRARWATSSMGFAVGPLTLSETVRTSK